MPKKNILYALTTLEVTSGVTSYLMAYYKSLDLTKYNVDFCIHVNNRGDYADMIESNGGHIYFMDVFSLKNVLSLRKRLRKVFESKKYDIVEVQIPVASYFYLKEAKRAGVPVRILHAHSTSAAGTKFTNFRDEIFQNIGKKYPNYRLACSEAAGKYLFGKKDFTVITNAINYSRFKFNQADRYEIRKRHNIKSDEFVIGFAGRICPEKNLPFMLEVLEQMKAQGISFKSFIIGSGPNDEEILKKIKEKNLEDVLIKLPATKEVAKYYNAFDCFLLPSIYEGLPVAGVEAQISGCNCIFSDTITEEANIFDVKYLSNRDHNAWINEIKRIMNNPRDRLNFVPNDNFNITTQYQKLVDFYEEALEKEAKE